MLGATKTVFVVEAFNTDRMDATLRDEERVDREMAQALQDADRERREAEAREQKEARRVAVTRSWKSADGAFSVEAEFVSKVGERVKLKRIDNDAEVFVEVSRLSEADQEWIKDWSARKK